MVETGDAGKGYLGLPASAWKRLDPAGIVVAFLFLGMPGLIWAGLDAAAAAGVACLLAILYFGWRCFDQWIGLKRDRAIQDHEALRVLADLAARSLDKQTPPGKGSLTKSGKGSSTGSKQKGG